MFTHHIRYCTIVGSVLRHGCVVRCHDTCTHLRLSVLDDPPPPPHKCNLLCLESSEGRHVSGRSARNLSEWFLCSPRNRSPSAAILILRRLEVHVFKIVAATRTQEVVHVCQNDLRPRRVIDHLRPVATSVVCAVLEGKRPSG